jgi:hypothetical protein
MKNHVLVFATLMFSTVFLHAQSPSKVSIYAHGAVGATNSITANLEVLISTLKNQAVRFYGRVGYGNLSATQSILCDKSVKASGGLVTATMLIGRKNHHFELGGGIFLRTSKQKTSKSFWCSEEFQSSAPVYELGYRFQKPEGGFLFRVTIGTLGTLGISLGTSF